MNKPYRKVMLVAAATLFAQAAWADSLKYLGPAYGGYVSTSGVITTPSAITPTPAAGGFLMENLTAPSGSFLAWCLDVQSWLTSPATFSLLTAAAFYPGLDGATRIDALERLATAVLPSLNSKGESGAFQLAVWEIVNEKAGPYSLADGNFKVASASDGAHALAGTWLTSLNDGTFSADNMTLSVWKDVNNSSQDLAVFAAPVPEPEIYAMMGIGLGLMGFMARRRKQRIAA